MQTIQTIQELRATLSLKTMSSAQEQRKTVGFVPTMGYLHKGHASLIRAAREICDIVVLSIFVNPLQFGPNEDFDKYPRDPERDAVIAAEAGVDIVFNPSVEEMYPEPIRTKVLVSELTDKLCGASRPGHFDGVATVVMKLFQIVKPDKAFFGLKDAQQVAVIEQMVKDMNMTVDIVACPILREQDGLAMSSRNVYLSEEERKQALVLSSALNTLSSLMNVNSAATTFGQLKVILQEQIKQASLADIDYVEILSYPRLELMNSHLLINQARVDYIVALAVKFGKTRLIDNRILRWKGEQRYV